jgi:hypothetical protein
MKLNRIIKIHENTFRKGLFGHPADLLEKSSVEHIYTKYT